MGSSYFIYGNYYDLLVTSVMCCFEVYKTSSPITNSLEELFRSLQDLLVLSLNPSLSFDSAEFLSRRLNGFERTLSVSYWSEVQLSQLLSDLDTLLFMASQQRQHCEDYLISFCTRRRKSNFQPPGWVL